MRKQKKLLSLLLALAMVLSLLPTVALAEGELLGTVEGISGLSVDISNNATDAVTVTTVTPTTALQWAEKNTSIGRNSDGWWFGIKIIAPNGAILQNDGDGHYQNWPYGASGWSVEKSFYTNRDSGDSTPVYMTAWGFVTPAILKDAKASESTIVYKWHFDWNNDGNYDQEIILNIDPDTVTLNKDEIQVYPVNASSYAAIINGTLYETLTAAVNAATDGQRVILLKDVTENVTIAAGQNITLDLNGCTLSGGTVARKAALTNNGTVTIKDNSDAGTGTIKREDNGTSGYYTIDNQGTMTIVSGNVYNMTGPMPSGSSLIRNAGVSSAATLNITGGNLRHDGFIAVKNDDYGILNISGGTITTTGDTETHTASAVQNWSTATITGGTINGAIWTSVWSNSFPDAVTTINNVDFSGKIITEKYSGSETTTPKLIINGGQYNVVYWTVGTGADVSISGGTFSSEPSADYIAAGYGAALVGDTYTVAKTYTATFAVAPSDAVVTVTCGGETVEPTEANTYSNLNSALAYSYTVTADGYEDMAGSIVAPEGSTVNIPVNLVRRTYTATFNVTPDTATVVVTQDGNVVAANPDKTYTLDKNSSYTYTVSADTYVTYVGTIAARAEATDITIPVSLERVTAYTVRFFSDVETEISDYRAQVYAGNKVAQPAVPTKTGYTFAGWYTDSAFTTQFDFDTAVNQNYDLIAKWTPINYTVSFNSNGGSAVENQSVAHNGTATRPTDPTRSGYTFAGWYSDSGLTTAYDFSTAVTADITLYANWSVIIYDYDDDTPSTPSTGTTTETTTNPDGSTTTTVTDKTTGSVTETTTSKPVTDEAGNTTQTVTETVTNKDGSTVETVTETVQAADGSTTETKTEVKTDADGAATTTETVTATDTTGTTATTTTTTDAAGETAVTVEVTVSEQAAAAAAESGAPVTLPVEVPAVTSTEDAVEVKVEVPAAADEVKVEVPVETVTPGTVVVLVKEDGTEEIVKTTTMGENGVIVSLDGSATVKIVDNSKVFEDVQPVDHWADDAVTYVAAREIFSGTSADTFEPETEMTRAMLMTVLARFEGEDTTGGATWYEKGMEWAVATGVSDGTNPDASITREQMAVMLYRYAGSPASDHELTFPDAGDVSDYAVEAMRWAVENGLINGMDGTLNPQGSATRAQVAAIMMRFCENVVK